MFWRFNFGVKKILEKNIFRLINSLNNSTKLLHKSNANKLYPWAFTRFLEFQSHSKLIGCWDKMLIAIPHKGRMNPRTAN